MAHVAANGVQKKRMDRWESLDKGDQGQAIGRQKMM
jgi:hypothetical protein